MVLLLLLCAFIKDKEYELPGIIGIYVAVIIILWFCNYISGVFAHLQREIINGSMVVNNLYWVVFFMIYIVLFMILSIYFSYWNDKSQDSNIYIGWILVSLLDILFDVGLVVILKQLLIEG